MPASLDDIVSHKRIEVEALKVRLRRMGNTTVMRAMTNVRSLKAVLRPGGQARPAPMVIPELKKADPWRGIFRDPFDILELAQILEEAGAEAYAVQTDNRYFKGSIDDLHYMARRTTLPVLMRDFIVDEAQLTEAKAKGADAAVLMSSILKDAELSQFIQFGKYIFLETLVEVASEPDVEKALSAGADLLGIQNRDLTNQEVSLERSATLRDAIPPEVMVVAVGGVQTAEDMQFLREHRYDAVVVGEAIMRAGDPAAAFADLLPH